MSLVCPIPKKMREEMAADPYYKTCCVADNECAGRIEWNHAKTYQSKRVNEIAFIVPMCNYHHRITNRKDISLRVEKICYQRTTPELLAKYKKMTWRNQRTQK